MYDEKNAERERREAQYSQAVPKSFPADKKKKAEKWVKDGYMVYSHEYKGEDIFEKATKKDPKLV